MVKRLGGYYDSQKIQNIKFLKTNISLIITNSQYNLLDLDPFL